MWVLNGIQAGLIEDFRERSFFITMYFGFFPHFQDPKMYVQTILDVHKKYNALVMSAFNNDAGFVAALDKVRWIIFGSDRACCALLCFSLIHFCLFVCFKQACGRFINNNAVTKMVQSSSKSPELLARYCDSLLKKSSKNPEEAELEDTLNQVVGFILTSLTKVLESPELLKWNVE